MKDEVCNAKLIKGQIFGAGVTMCLGIPVFHTEICSSNSGFNDSNLLAANVYHGGC